jgi:hypothetical protein
MDIYKLDLAGLDQDERVKFLGLLPTYGTSSSQPNLCSGTTAVGSTAEYIEWAFIDDIEVGQLYDQPIVSPTGNTSFNITVINKLDFSWGGYVNATGGSGTMWIATNGGLLSWDGSNMALWNTLNSNSPSDFVNTLTVDPYNVLWVGTNAGLSSFSPVEGFASKWNLSNSGILSNNVLSLKVYAPNNVAIGTDNGLSLYDSSNNGWKGFNSYNTASLHHNQISCLSSESNYIFAGTTGGVYVYNYFTDQWNTSPFNSSSPGWSAPDAVMSMEVYNGNIYVGTTGGMVVLPYLGGTASTIVSGVTGPPSNYFKSMRLVTKGTDKRLYIGHDDGYSVYSITTSTWLNSATSSSYPYLGAGVSDILPDYLSTSTQDTIFFGSQDPTEGLARLFLGGVTGPSASGFSYVPEADKLTNILLSYPLNPSCTPLAPQIGKPGQWQTFLNNTTNVDSSRLYANRQPVYFVFSKDIRATPSVNFLTKCSLSEGLTGAGATVSGTWAANQPGRVLVFTPDDPLAKASPYNLSVIQGSTSLDGSNVREKINVGFYTEDITPILGWKVLGKMLVHTGAENNYTQGLYLRNPQFTGVNITTLIGR